MIMKTVYMNEDGEISITLTKYADGVGFEVTKEDYLTAQDVEEIKKEEVDRIVKEIESAAKIRGIKKFAVGDSFWSDTPPEYVRKRIAKAVELAELKGYKFVGGITTSDKPFGSNTPVNRSDQSSSFKRWCFIEFEETVTHPPETIDSVEIVKVVSWYKPWTWFVG